jgi:hypothetical protein
VCNGVVNSHDLPPLSSAGRPNAGVPLACHRIRHRPEGQRPPNRRRDRAVPSPFNLRVEWPAGLAELSERPPIELVAEKARFPEGAENRRGARIISRSNSSRQPGARSASFASRGWRVPMEGPRRTQICQDILVSDRTPGCPSGAAGFDASGGPGGLTIAEQGMPIVAVGTSLSSIDPLHLSALPIPGPDDLPPYRNLRESNLLDALALVRAKAEFRM